VGSDQSTVRYRPSHESLFLGVTGELGAAIDAELLIDIMEMDLDRSLADEEFLADLHVAQSGRHLFDNFDFSGRQHLRDLVSCGLALEQFFQSKLNSGLIIPCFPPGQIYLGSDSFIKKHAHENKKQTEIPRVQLQAARPSLQQIFNRRGKTPLRRRTQTMATR
jgi:hypothetical protein